MRFLSAPSLTERTWGLFFEGLPLSGGMDCLVRVAAIDKNVSEDGHV